MTSPDPFIDPEVDLSDYPFMGLEVRRLRDSDLVALASAEAFRAAVLLWCVAWHQVPAGSLPIDDRLLMRFVHLDATTWAEVKPDALRGFVQCSDGRLYHPLICEKARDAWARRSAASKKGRAGAKARFEREQRQKRELAQAQASPSLSTGTAQASPSLACAQPVFSKREREGERDLNTGNHEAVLDSDQGEEYSPGRAREAVSNG